MNCPKCHRNLAPTISVCTSCGTMVKDSVREELEFKIYTAAKPVKSELQGKTPMSNKSIQPSSAQPPPTNGKNLSVNKTGTTEINHKLTSPMVIGFQSKSAAIPEWRLDLQNAVRQRREKNQSPEKENVSVPALSVVHRTNGSAALKAEILENPESVLHENETVNNALHRIEQSRKKFYVEEQPSIVPTESTQKKNHPFYIATKSNGATATKSETRISTNFTAVAKPKLVSSLRNGNPDFDTNKLPPLPQSVKMSTSFTKLSVGTTEQSETAVIEKPEEKIKPDLPKIEISRLSEEVAEEIIEAETEEIEDCAPFAMRFNAGVFDILIGSFAGLILLAPFILLGGNWFTAAGFFAFLATSAIIMFVYMTTAIGLFGKTFGMKMFALELIDIGENDYPSFHQAAVSSSVYLLSLALGGSGFLTVPFTADRRAVHDLVSGTVVVREYESVVET